MNQKGGVAKTTTCINLAVKLAEKGKTLVIDTDEQANLSRQFGVDDPATTIRDALLGESFEPVTVRKGLDLLPASSELIGIERILTNEMNRERKLSKALESISGQYRYILIDCPSNTSMVTVNALSVSDYVILPIKAEIFSVEGINHMVEFITMIRENINERLKVMGILITQFDERLKVAQSILETIKSQGWDNAVFKTRIRKNTDIAASQVEQLPVYEYNPKSRGARDYSEFFKEVYTKLK